MMNNKLTPKRMFILTSLLLVGCYSEIDPHTTTTHEDYYYQTDIQQIPNQTQVTKHKPYVVNNTPHIQHLRMSKQYNEKPKDIGLVDMNGRIL